MVAMFNSLNKIWGVYSNKVFFGNIKDESSEMLGWEFTISEHRVSSYDSIDKLYKDHILIKRERIQGKSCRSWVDAFSLYLVDDINDLNPVLIYYCYDYANVSSASDATGGWINIDYWSIFAKKIIDDSINIINQQEQFEEFAKYVEKEKLFTENIKPKLCKFFKEQVLSLDTKTILRLSKDVLNDKELNYYTRRKDAEDARLVADILSETTEN